MTGAALWNLLVDGLIWYGVIELVLVVCILSALVRVDDRPRPHEQATDQLHNEIDIYRHNYHSGPQWIRDELESKYKPFRD